MDVLVNYMHKMTIHVPSLTIEYYVLKKNGYKHNSFHIDFDVSVNKSIFCNCINILYCTFLDIDNIEKKVGLTILFICEDVKEKSKNLPYWR